MNSAILMNSSHPPLWDDDQHDYKVHANNRKEYGDFVCNDNKTLIRVNSDKISFYNMDGLQNVASKSSKNDFVYYTKNRKNERNDKHMRYYPKHDVWRLIEKNQQPSNEWKRKRNIETSKDTTFVIVLGKTGLGKSSIIKLLTKDPFIEVSGQGKNIDSTESCTKATSLHQQLYNDSNVLFFDTMGTQDSKQEESDEYILNDIQQRIYQKHGTKVKFIWVVPDEIRSTGYLKTQAKFIHQFGVHPDTYNNDEIKQDDNNIWDSVLMVVSKPSALVKLKDAQKGGALGAIGASVEYGAPPKQWKTKNNLIGFTNVDWIIKNENNKNNKPGKLSDKDSDDDNDDDSMESICNNPKRKKKYHYYNNKDIENMIFKYLSDQNIKPFNIIFKDYKCNICKLITDPRFSNHHKCHSTKRGVHKRHPTYKPEIKHISEFTGKTKKVHWGQLLAVHKQEPSEYYHKGKLRMQHSKSLTLTTSGKVCSVLGVLGGAALSAGLNQMIKCRYYPCCNGDKDSEGCQLIYTCCQADTSSKGCEKILLKDSIYPCCNISYGDPGCVRFYSCCQRNETSIGCQDACNTCNAVLEGNSKKCGFRWPCCGAYGKLNDLKTNNGYKGCKDACCNCEGILGESKGCISYPDAEHIMEPI